MLRSNTLSGYTGSPSKMRARRRAGCEFVARTCGRAPRPMPWRLPFRPRWSAILHQHRQRLR